MTDRISEVVRNTNETKIRVRLNLDGTGQGTLNTGIPFLDHMIDQIKRHGLFDIDIHCEGDLEIDDHHTVEDCGITWSSRPVYGYSIYPCHDRPF